MNKLIPTTEETYKMLWDLFGVHSKSEVNTIITSGHYVITDESGLGIEGIAKVNNGSVYWDTLKNKNNSLAFSFDNTFTLKKRHKELKAKIEGIPFEFAVFCLGGGDLAFEIGESCINFYEGQWDIIGQSTNEWKGFLVENNLTEEGILMEFKKLQGLNFDATAFFYSPVKGLHLP